MSTAITQVAVVVPNLESAMDAYHRLFGWGPWRVYDFNQIPHAQTTVHGRPETYSMRTAVTNVGGLDFELIEPSEGPSHYQQFLTEHGPGLHHVMCQNTDGTSVTSHLTANGLTPVMSGAVGDGAATYTYFDGGVRLGGIILETMDNGPADTQLVPSYLYTPGSS